MKSFQFCNLRGHLSQFLHRIWKYLPDTNASSNCLMTVFAGLNLLPFGQISVLPLVLSKRLRAVPFEEASVPFEKASVPNEFLSVPNERLSVPSE